MSSEILVIGLSHRTAPVELREQLSVATENVGAELRSVMNGSPITEGVLLSTCNRVEVVCATRSLETARLRLRSFFERELDREAGGPRDPAVGAALYEYDDTGAVYPLTVDPILAGPFWTFEGDQPDARLGVSVAAAR